MIGHSSVLIETSGVRILTDPWFGGGNLVYTRTRPPACTREAVADVNLVLVSHNHYDHVDSAYFRMLPAATPVVAPAGTAWVTKRKGARNVVALPVWGRQRFGSLTVTAVPAWHSTLPHGYVLQSDGATVYFAADTYYGRFMERIAAEFKPKIVLMPVASFRLPPTMGGSGALAAARTLTPEVIIPIHLGITPRNPLLRTSQTPEQFGERLKKDGRASQLVFLREGESWSDARAAVR